MQTFDDFDAWAETIRTADLRLACDRVEKPVWRLATRRVGQVFLQAATEGGGNLCYGGNTHPGTLLFVPLTRATQQVANCERLDSGSVLVIPRGADFTIRVRGRAHAWCSIAIPDGPLEPAPWRRPGDRPGSFVARPGTKHVDRLRGLVRRLIGGPLGCRQAEHAAARAVVSAAFDCLSTPCGPADVMGRPRVDRLTVIRRTLAHIERDPLSRPAVGALAAELGVNERTLLRVFHDAWDVNPRDYLRLEQMHRIRRALRSADPYESTVTDVLTRHGIWEFGRFAARYRRQFGESPSDTLRGRSAAISPPAASSPPPSHGRD